MNLHYNGVGYHIIFSIRCKPDLVNFSAKGQVRIGIYGEFDSLSLSDLANISLIYISLYLHPGKIFSYGEKSGS